LPASGLADVSMKMDVSQKGKYGFKLLNDLGEYVQFHYDTEHKKLFFDRTRSGTTSFSNDFPAIHEKIRTSTDNKITIRALVDVSSIEIFVDGGQDVFTEIFFPGALYNQLELVKEGNVKGLLEGEVVEVKRVW
jgi:fructan beta-fructosidase